MPTSTETLQENDLGAREEKNILTSAALSRHRHRVPPGHGKDMEPFCKVTGGQECPLPIGEPNKCGCSGWEKGSFHRGAVEGD